MASEDVEKLLKKKLQAFLAEMLRLGTVKGFCHFEMHQRGREELLLNIINEPLTPDSSYFRDVIPRLSLSGSGSFTSGNLPYDKRSLMLSGRTQRKLSGYGEIGIGLPPASPSDTEIATSDENSTLFLLAAYGRYNCPYVWVRSNHDRLITLTGEGGREKDCPLRLKSTSAWKDSHIRAWDIIAELVKLCTYPPPLNPFAVDFAYFDDLEPHEKYLASGAMVNFLQRVVLASSDDKQYIAKVSEDLQSVTKLHFASLQDLVSCQNSDSNRGQSSQGSRRNVTDEQSQFAYNQFTRRWEMPT